jgi:hypothetical protein
LRTGWSGIVVGLVGLYLAIGPSISTPLTLQSFIAVQVTIRAIGFVLLLVAGYLLMRKSPRR